MARDWIDILKRIEAAYPESIGGANKDDNLRAALVPIANDAMAEITREQRWFSQFTQNSSVVTTANTQTYACPANITAIKRIYYVDAVGKPHDLQYMDKRELQRVYGDYYSTAGNVGAPVKFALESSAGSQTGTIFLFPTPDFAGPTSGNYTLIIEGYTGLLPVVETTATTTTGGAATTLTVPSTAYLTDLGVQSASTSGATLSVRGAGNLQFAATPDTLQSGWSAFATGTTVTMTTAALAVVTAGQCFFQSSNWLITNFPKVLLYYVLAEIAASYYGDAQKASVWKGMRDENMEKLRAYEFDRTTPLEILAVAQVGQYANALQRSETLTTIDIRGAS